MFLRTVWGPLGPFWALLGHLRHFWWFGAILGHFGPFRGPRGSQNGPMGGPIWHIIMYYIPENCFRATRTILGLVGPFSPLLIILGHFRPFWAILGPPWVPKWPQGGPTSHIIVYYTHRDCFRAIRTLPDRYLALGSVSSSGSVSRTTNFNFAVVKNFSWIYWPRPISKCKMVLDLYFGPFWDKSEVMFFQKMAICEYLILAIFSRFWLFWAHFGPEMSKVYLFQLFRCKINNEIKKVDPFDCFKNWTPKVLQNPPRTQKHP